MAERTLGFERGTWFLSAAHGPAEIDRTVDAATAVLDQLAARR